MDEPDICSYEELNQPILCCFIAPVKPNVFVDDIEWLLVLLQKFCIPKIKMYTRVYMRIR